MIEYEETLLKKVMKLSESKHWEDAVSEWEITSCVEDLVSTSQCVCGKENIRYLYTLENSITGSSLHPVGIDCITKFNRADLLEEARVRESLFILLHKLEDCTSVILNSEFFSEELLRYLYEQGAFVPTKYNDNNGYNDYRFLVTMYKRRSKATTWVEPKISKAQYKKMTAIIMNSVLLYLRENLVVIK